MYSVAKVNTNTCMFLVGLTLFNKIKSEQIGNDVQLEMNLTPKWVASQMSR